jgi:hypothetical protein
MCQRITCKTCGKPSFAGCGRHVESVLADVPVAERCQGHARAEKPSAEKSGRPDTASRNPLKGAFRWLGGSS